MAESATHGVPQERHFPAAGIDALRALALLSLAASHMGFMGLPTRVGHLCGQVVRVGWVGTDLFLVISGFLCVESLRRRGARGAGGWLAFLKARAARVLPAYFAFLAIYLWLVPVSLQGLSVPTPAVYRSLDLALSRLPPFLLTVSIDLYYAFSGRNVGAALEGLFAIGVGVQATLAVSVLFAWLPRRRFVYALWLGIGAAHLARLYLFREEWPYVIYANPVCRSEPFFWGGLLSLGLDRPAVSNFLRRRAVSLTVILWGLLLALAAVTRFLSVHAELTKLVGYPLAALASFFTVASVTNQTRIPSPAKRLALLGPATYAMYLLKLPLLSTLWRGLEGLSLPPVVELLLKPALGFTALVLGGCLYLRWVEAPLSRIVNHQGRRE